MLRISCLLTLLGILLSAAAATDSTLKLKWQNQSRNDLIVTTSNDTVQLEVKKQGKFDGAAAVQFCPMCRRKQWCSAAK